MRRRLVDDDVDARHLELARDARGDARALVVLAVGPHDDEQDVRDDEREERLLVQARVRVDEQHVERQGVHELADARGEPLGVVALAQDAGDLARLHARRDEEQPAGDVGVEPVGDVEGDVGDLTPVPQVVVQRRGDRVAGEAEQDVDARRLDVAVDDADAMPGRGDDGGQVGGRVRLAGSATERVDRDDRGHGLGRSVVRCAEGTRSAPPL